MIGDSLSFKNLLTIKQAMDKIKSIDQSDFFKKYYQEVIDRLDDDGGKKDILSKYQ